MLQFTLGFERYLFIFSLFIIKTLRWNKNERDFIHFLQMIPDGGIVLDIGANIGVMSVWLGKKLKQSKIYAFEPIPQNVKTLKRVLRHFKIHNVTVIEKAVGNTHGSVQMVMPVLGKVKMQGLSHVMHETITDFNEGNRYSAPIITIDSFENINTTGKSLTAIKLDVENFEYYVLDGAKETIQKHRPLIYTELWENTNRDNCFKFIRAHGYKVCVLVQHQLIEFDPSLHTTQNFFFIP